MPLDQPPKLPLGASCKMPIECQSLKCFQGVCCNAPCGGACQACDQGASKGQCLPVPAGKDPHNSCAKQPVSGCGQDGECNGAGQCRKYLAGTECAAGVCNAGDTAVTGIKKCDGNGACLAKTDQNCFPFKCNPAANACHASCTKSNQNAHCAGYYACNANISQCYSKCTSDSHCKSNGECNNSSKKCKKD